MHCIHFGEMVLQLYLCLLKYMHDTHIHTNTQTDRERERCTERYIQTHVRAHTHTHCPRGLNPRSFPVGETLPSSGAFWVAQVRDMYLLVPMISGRKANLRLKLQIYLKCWFEMYTHNHSPLLADTETVADSLTLRLTGVKTVNEKWLFKKYN